MPNHVTNILTTGGSHKALKSLLNADGDVDFNTIIPMPSCLREFEIHGGIEERAIAALGLAEMPTENDMMSRIKFSNLARIITREIETAEIDQVITALTNWRETGYIYWNPWACDHWGTKWNAYQQNISENALKFETAWRTPKPVFEALSSQKPYAKFIIEYADEDIGRNCGRLVYQGGNLIEEWHPKEGREANKFAFELVYPGEDPANHERDENYEYVETE